MIDEIQSRNKKEIIQNMRDQFAATGKLSPKQYDVLTQEYLKLKLGSQERKRVLRYY